MYLEPEQYGTAAAHVKAKEIAAAMGRRWSYDETEIRSARAAYIEGQNGARIVLLLEPDWDEPGHVNHRYRLGVMGCYPRVYNADTEPRESPGKITCSPKRSAEAIARDILGRLVPEYLVALEKAKAIGAQYERQIFQMLDGMGALSETLEVEFNAQLDPYRTTVLRWSGRSADPNRLHTTIEWHGPYGITVNATNMPLELAVEIAETIKRFDENLLKGEAA